MSVDKPLRFEHHDAVKPTDDEKKHLEYPMNASPAEYVISVFGGVRALGRAIGRSPGSVSRWQRAKSNRGTGGDIPRAAQKLILDQAKKEGLDITANDLIHGRKVTKRKV